MLMQPAQSRVMLEQGHRLHRERFETTRGFGLQLSDVQSLNVPVVSTISEATGKDLRQITGVKPRLEIRIAK
jgi:hypothetical protein